LEAVEAKEQLTLTLLLHTHTSLLLLKFLVSPLLNIVESHLLVKTPPVDLACLPGWECPQTQSKRASCRKAACEQSGRKV
jgi:hypothetical protein